MNIQVSGRRLDIGDALRGHVEERMAAIAEKFLDNTIDCQVTLGKESHLFHADCALHLPHGVYMQADARADDARAAFEAVADKIEKQLRRYKRRLKDRHLKSRLGREAEEAMIARAYILAPEEDGGEAVAEPRPEPEGAAVEDVPMIIAESRTGIPHATVGDAVMLMDLSDVPALMFRNRRNNRLNVVYRRQDGNIGWVDPAGSEI